ncbi:MAG TPA: hypothetical protein VFU90_15160, partial [Candidatus Tumulicola sp.]|nr:hypothetical protein [Candidatus Tumulicola sp.]
MLVGEGAAAFVSVPLASGKILIGQGAADPAAQSVSGDGTLSAAGVLTISGLQGVTLPAPATGYLLFGQGSGLSWNGPLSQPTATAFYIDPAGGSDAAAGTSLAPLKTFREAVGRIGSFRPAFPSSATVTFHILSSQTDLSDPIVWSPVSGNTVFVGTPILQATSALANVSYSAGGVVTATIAGASLGDMVVNNAKGGVAFVGNVVGSTCTLSVPSASNVPFSTAAPAAVLNWANGDSYSRYTLPQVYAPNVGCDITSAYTANIQLQHLNVGITGHSYMATGTVGMLECAVTTPYTSSTVFFDTRGGSFINCFVSGQLQFGGGYFYAGALYNATGDASAIVIERVAIAGGALLCGNGGMYLELSEVSSLNVASTNPNINLIGNNNFGSGSPSTIYGTYTLNLASGLTGESVGCLTYFGTAAATFLGNPTFTFGAGSQAGAVSFGNALDVGTGVAQWYPHRALYVTNLDLAVALGGFGGRAFSDFGSFITNGTQGTTAPGTLATTDWYINAATGSDANAGTSSGAP